MAAMNDRDGTIGIKQGTQADLNTDEDAQVKLEKQVGTEVQSEVASKAQDLAASARENVAGRFQDDPQDVAARGPEHSMFFD